MERTTPIIGISAGDPAGIGPEICVKALNDAHLYSQCRPLLICDAGVIREAIQICKLDLGIHEIVHPNEGRYTFGTIDVLNISNISTKSNRYGEVSAMCGSASFEYVVKAIRLAQKKEVDATVTGPINKEALSLAGLNFPGHTEIFAHYTKTKDFAMMLADKNFRVIHVSTHVSMLDAIKSVTKERVLRVIEIAHSALVQMGINNPRIAVNGLNAHAGENGLFGREELDHIIPAIKDAKRDGIGVDGPHPPDTIFPKLKGGEYDIVVCMYHDQGHIPTKLNGFNYNHGTRIWEGISGINITLGLPIIRVSVDHGTAFDKAGDGSANPESMIQAILYAAKLSKNTQNE